MTETKEKTLNKESETVVKVSLDISLEDMAEAGLHFGHKTSRTNPKMKPYIFGVRNSVHIIDLEKTKEQLEEALNFIAGLVARNEKILFIGTKIQVRGFVKEVAENCGMPYIIERWLGGIFTNFETISKRVEYFKELEKKREGGELEKYTKKERALFDKEILTLEKKFGGIKSMPKIPEAIFVCSMKKDELAIKEARAKSVKIVGIAHSDVDPTLADYPISANDDSLLSVRYILSKVQEAILKVKERG